MHRLIILLSSLDSSVGVVLYIKWFKYDRDWFVCKSGDISPGHIWTTLYVHSVVYIAIRVGFGPVQSSRYEDKTAINKKHWGFFSLSRRPDAFQGLLIHKVSRSHSDTPQSVGLLWTSDRLVSETSTWQHSQQTDINAPGGIRTRNPSIRAPADPRLRPCGHCDRPAV